MEGFGGVLSREAIAKLVKFESKLCIPHVIIPINIIFKFINRPSFVSKGATWGLEAVQIGKTSAQQKFKSMVRRQEG